MARQRGSITVWYAIGARISSQEKYIFICLKKHPGNQYEKVNADGLKVSILCDIKEKMGYLIENTCMHRYPLKDIAEIPLPFRKAISHHVLIAFEPSYASSMSLASRALGKHATTE